MGRVDNYHLTSGAAATLLLPLWLTTDNGNSG